MISKFLKKYANHGIAHFIKYGLVGSLGLLVDMVLFFLENYQFDLY